MTQTRWEYSLTYFFIFLSALIVLLIFLQLYFGKNYQAQLTEELKNVNSAGFEMQDIPNYQFNELPLTDFNELVERPLFFKDRRPVIPTDSNETDIYQNVPVKIEMTLIGIIDTPNEVYALFNNPRAKPNESKFSRLKQGEELSGWKIKEIKSDRVLIESKEGTDEILLAKPRPKKTAQVKKKAKAKAKKKAKIPAKKAVSKQTKDIKKTTANPFKREPKK